jgi:predicted ATPase/DNA-binding winged helix-turn-helix (wHTH) protein
LPEQSATSAKRAVSFGPFRLLPAQQLLLEGDAPVRLGSRALEILTALVERAGELVTKTELMARVWPDTVVEESNLKVHVAALRRALGDGQPGRRYLANVPGRGYRFVAPVNLAEPDEHLVPKSAAPERVRDHNLPISQSRALGRADTISALRDQLPRHRFITIVGAGGVGKTTVALALAEALLPAYEHGIWFVDLAPLDDPQLVSTTLASTLGLAVRSENAATGLVDFLRDRRMLIVLDNCEHVIDAAAAMAQQLLGGAPGVHVLATSREPLRARGERVHRLLPLEIPPDPSGLTASEAGAYASVQLFVERAAAIVDSFELSDTDAPVVADICRKLGGIALAIELAAARVDAFGVQQLSALLDDRFRILNQGTRTVQPRHRSLVATFDWSYGYLPENERAVLRRLAVFAGIFTLESAVAVAADSKTDVVEGVAHLVAKSLISFDVGGPVARYRLLDTTRAYAMQKLTDSGEFQEYARRHAEHHRHWFEGAEADWLARPPTEWLQDYGRAIDDVRNALTWAFSPNGDASVGIALTIGSIRLWLQSSLMDELREYIERALARQAALPTQRERDEMKLLEAREFVLLYTTGQLPENDGLWRKVLRIAEKLGDDEYRGRALWGLSVYHLYRGDFRELLSIAQNFSTIDKSSNPLPGVMHSFMTGTALHYLGDQTSARQHFDSMVNQNFTPERHALFAHRTAASAKLSIILWMQGFPDQAVRKAQSAIDDARSLGNALLLCNILAHATCPLALYVGDLATAERWVAMLLDRSSKHALTARNAQGRCLQGMLLLAQGDIAGVELLRTALEWLRQARFGLGHTISLGALAQGLAAAGQMAEAHIAIDEALERSDRNEERWCMPELLRIKGELVLSDGPAAAAETAESFFLQALDWARRQVALSWELRTATSLAKLWHQDGKTSEANDLLSAVYQRFDEGFDTSDLMAARALMDEFCRTSTVNRS